MSDGIWNLEIKIPKLGLECEQSNMVEWCELSSYSFDNRGMLFSPMQQIQIE